MIFFVTGTDTGVGKTYATALLASGFKKVGKRITTQKLVQTGANSPEDLEIHSRLAGLELPPLKLSCPYIFSYPAAPETAASLEGKRIDILYLKDIVEKLKKKYEIILIEGVGGLYVPLNQEYTVLDFINLLMCPVFVVSAARLGTINHTVLTIKALKQRGIHVAGLLYNWHFATDEFLARQSLSDIKRLTGIDNVLEFPTLPENLPPQLIDMAARFLERILRVPFNFSSSTLPHEP